MWRWLVHTWQERGRWRAPATKLGSMGETTLMSTLGSLTRVSRAAATFLTNWETWWPGRQDSRQRSEWPAATVTSFQWKFMFTSGACSILETSSSAWSAKSPLSASLLARLKPLRVKVPLEAPTSPGWNCLRRLGRVVNSRQSPSPPMAKETSGKFWKMSTVVLARAAGATMR